MVWIDACRGGFLLTPPLKFTPQKLNCTGPFPFCSSFKDCPTANDVLRRLTSFRTAAPPSQALLGDALLRWIDFDLRLFSAAIRAGELGISFATRC
jgi:hypothetical protein